MTCLKSKPTKVWSSGTIFSAALAAALLAAVTVQCSVVPRVRSSIDVLFPDAQCATNAVVAIGAVASPNVASASCSSASDARDGVELAEVKVGRKASLEGDDPRAGQSSGLAACDASAAVNASSMMQSEPNVATSRGGGILRSRHEAAAVYAFRNLLIFVAFLESFAHGANDTANATSAMSAVLHAYTRGVYACSQLATEWWLMSLAGVFVALGVNMMGYQVIQTLGKDLTAIDFQVGFAIELAATLTVVVAIVVGGLPVSTTHCKVGAIVAVGLVSGAEGGVQWHLLGKIVFTWVLTVPLAGAGAAFLTAIFRSAITVD
mmetsp:Transcript_12257/g.31314  ORF Transcript_12257/g.31314 Transcript_12257/m.31314 type:complete len:320 (+) Transcript_12257:884-1843(+)